MEEKLLNSIDGVFFFFKGEKSKSKLMEHFFIALMAICAINS